MTRIIASFVLVLAASLQAEDATALFVRRVWPLFQEKCLACHGNDEQKIKGGFDMRTLESTLKGGESETKAIVPAQPEKARSTSPPPASTKPTGNPCRRRTQTNYTPRSLHGSKTGSPAEPHGLMKQNAAP